MEKGTYLQEQSLWIKFAQKIWSSITRTFWIIVRTFSYLFIELPYQWLRKKVSLFVIDEE